MINRDCFFMQLKLLVVASIGFILLACKSPPPLEQSEDLDLSQNTAHLNTWEIRGKIAWINEKERESANLRWRQNNQTLQFNLNTTLGINVASMNFDGQQASLVADNKIYQGSDPESLIFQITGRKFPISALSHWVKGSFINLSNYRVEIESYENGLPRSAYVVCIINEENCTNWQIDYTSFKPVFIRQQTYQLPTSIALTDKIEGTKIKLKINQWNEGGSIER